MDDTVAVLVSESKQERADVVMVELLADVSAAAASALCTRLSASTLLPLCINAGSVAAIEAALQSIPGKSLVNIGGLGESVEAFVSKARLCVKYGAAVLVQAVDTSGKVP